MSDLHIDDFFRDAAKTLILLYSRFPQKTILYVEDIAGPDSPDEFGLHSPRFMAGFHTLLWLAQTDYIQYSQPIRQEALEDATLTHRCFTFLCGPDSGVQDDLFAGELESDTLLRRIDILKAALAHKSSDFLTQLMLRFMNESRSFS